MFCRVMSEDTGKFEMGWFRIQNEDVEQESATVIMDGPGIVINPDGEIGCGFFEMGKLITQCAMKEVTLDSVEDDDLIKVEL